MCQTWSTLMNWAVMAEIWLRWIFLFLCFFQGFPPFSNVWITQETHERESSVPPLKQPKTKNKSVGKFRPIRQSRENPPAKGGIRFPLTTVGRRSERRRRRRRRYRTAVSIVTDELVATAGTFPPTNPCLYFGVNPPPFPPTRPKSILRRMTIRRDTYTTHSKVKGSYS